MEFQTSCLNRFNFLQKCYVALFLRGVTARDACGLQSINGVNALFPFVSAAQTALFSNTN